LDRKSDALCAKLLNTSRSTFSIATLLTPALYNFPYVQSLLSNYNSSEINREISDKETMFDQWYFEMGRYAIEAISLSIMASKIKNEMVGPEITKVLDVPCGHGRVLRHLVNMFPKADIHACDLDREGVDFCASTFGGIPIYSQEDMTKVDFGCEYDVIWVGSLFTHTSRETTKKWMAHLARYLSPHGIIVATIHGRWSEYVHKVAPYIRKDKWQEILGEYNQSGHGYRDYYKNESHQFIQGSYGISIAKPHITIEDIEKIPNTRIYTYLERGWGDHQDVVAFGRPSYAELWPHHKPTDGLVEPE
jgi:2-polyprenyl-3-methyl-5-hydroxy-6-metoxy-1,4-benzoquinol methylase